MIARRVVLFLFLATASACGSPSLVDGCRKLAALCGDGGDIMPYCGVEPSSPEAEQQEKDLRDSLTDEEIDKLNAFAECLDDAETCATISMCQLGIE